MSTPVQKNYTIYIYIYVQYINLFLLSPSNKHPPAHPPKKSPQLSVADPKTYNKRENKQSFSLSFSHCGIRYWCLKMKPKRKHANESYQKCKHGGYHLCYTGCGRAGGAGGGWSILPPRSLHLPFGFPLLRQGVLLRRGSRSKRSEVGL